MEFGSEGSEEGKVVRSMIGQLPKLHCSEGKGQIGGSSSGLTFCLAAVDADR